MRAQRRSAGYRSWIEGGVIGGHENAVLALTAYDKDEMADLTPPQRKALKAMIKAELEARRMT